MEVAVSWQQVPPAQSRLPAGSPRDTAQPLHTLTVLEVSVLLCPSTLPTLTATPDVF